jgi:hypothetical protein
VEESSPTHCCCSRSPIIRTDSVEIDRAALVSESEGSDFIIDRINANDECSMMNWNIWNVRLVEYRNKKPSTRLKLIVSYVQSSCRDMSKVISLDNGGDMGIVDGHCVISNKKCRLCAFPSKNLLQTSITSYVNYDPYLPISISDD